MRQTDRRTNDETDAPARRLVRRIFHWASADGVFSECRSHSADLCRTTDCSSLPAAMNRKHGRRRPITSSPCADGFLCAIICPLILILDPSRGPIGDFKKNFGRHSRCRAERCNSRWRPRWPPHPYIQYNSICICLGVMNLVSLRRFWGSRNSLKSFSG